MYKVTVQGRTLMELKKAASDISKELNNGVLVNGIEKDLSPIEKVSVEANEQFKEEMKNIPYKELTTPDPVLGMSKSIAETIEEAVAPTPVIEQAVAVDSNDRIALDAEGLPWDKRIHASSRGIVKAGTWRTKRGIDETLLAQVKEELRNNMQLLANPTPIPELPAATGPAPVIAPAVYSEPVETPVLAAPVVPVVDDIKASPVVAAPVPQPIMPVSGGHTLETFSANYAMVLSSLMNEGKVTPEYVNQLKAYFKVVEIWDISEAQKGEMFESFAGSGFITKVS